MENKKFYRYETINYTNGKMLQLIELNMHKETKKGFWIGYGSLEEGNLRSQSIWVSKTSVKRYAYPTPEEAQKNFIKRNEKRIKILKKQILSCEENIDLLNK